MLILPPSEMEDFRGRHQLANYHGKIDMTNQLQRALEYNADMFAVNQICYHMMRDYDLFGKYAKDGESTMGMMVVSQAQQCWNEYYARLEPYISPSVQLSECNVLNIAAKGYTE